MRLTVPDDWTLEEAGIAENMKINLQDQSILNKKSRQNDFSNHIMQQSNNQHIIINQAVSIPELVHLDLILQKFIERNSLFEFIDIVQMYMNQSKSQNAQASQDSASERQIIQAIIDVNRLMNSIGKTYLHMAVECKSKQIISYLLFDTKADPNILTKDSQMGALHIAVQMQSIDIIELLLTSEKTNIDLQSPLHGTPLHVACVGGSVKIVQQLLINNADFNIRSSKQKLAKEVTRNHRIIYLIEKYEKLFRQMEFEEEEKTSSKGSFSNSPQQKKQERRGSVAINNQSSKFEMQNVPTQRRASVATHGSVQGKQSLEAIKEEDISDEEKIERQAGSSLDQAEIYIKDFERSKIELIPTVRGELIAQGSLKKKQKMRYFVLNAFEGEFVKFEKKDHYQKILKSGVSLTNKIKEKFKIETIHLKDVMSVNSSFLGDFRKKNQHAIEMTFYTEQIVYFSTFHPDQIKEWLDLLSKAKRFNEWVCNIQNLLREEEKLTEQMKFKLQEIIQFCEQFCDSEIKEINFIGSKEAEQLQKQRLQELNVKTQGLQNEESKGAYFDQNSPEFQEKVQFKDFEIIDHLGEGSFGRVFKVRHRVTGEISAMKAMRKQQLVMNNQIKYAVSEAAIMKQLNHPYILKCLYAFQTPQYLYMVSEICDNGDLANHLDHLNFLDEKLAKFIIAELILAIQYIHQKKILYRDLKPENILIDQEGHIRLADFGLAKQAIDGNKMSAQSFCGSPAYLAPEMVRQQGITEAGDVYQIGVVLYEILVGIPPYYDDNIKILYHNIEKGKLKLPKYLSNEAKKFLIRILHKDPKKRPTLNEIKYDEFFSDLNWNKLEQKEMNPPHILSKEYIQELERKKKAEQQIDKEMQELESLFEVDESGIKIECNFDDEDYAEHNKLMNRVRSFSYSYKQ